MEEMLRGEVKQYANISYYAKVPRKRRELKVIDVVTRENFRQIW